MFWRAAQRSAREARGAQDGPGEPVAFLLDEHDGAVRFARQHFRERERQAGAVLGIPHAQHLPAGNDLDVGERLAFVLAALDRQVLDIDAIEDTLGVVLKAKDDIDAIRGERLAGLLQRALAK